MHWASYNTNQPPSVFAGNQLLGALVRLVPIPFRVVLLVWAADLAVRKTFPERLPITSAIKRQFWISREVCRAVFVGCCLAFAHAAYVSVFYIAGRTVGVWAPLSEPYGNALATPLPWVYPMFTALIASIDEELLFRLFAVALLMRLVGRRWVAVLVPAAAWAFLHSNYPQYPIYVRGLELTLVGVVYAAAMLRYGFAAPMIAHYGYNALVGTALLRGSDNLYLQWAGAGVVGVMFMPLIPCFLVLVRRKPLATNEEVLATSATDRPDSGGRGDAGHVRSTCYRPFATTPSRRLCTLAAVAVVAATTLVLDYAKGRDYFAEVRVTRKQAQAIADAFLEDKGVSTGRFRKEVEFWEDVSGDQFDYAYQQLGDEEFEPFCRAHLSGNVHWSVRYFVPPEKEEYFVAVLANGEVFNYTHVLPEDAPGAKLEQYEAVQRAEQYLRHDKGIDLADFRLVSASANELPSRTDHHLVWENASARIGQGSLRVSLIVRGDEAMDYGSFVEVPEEWLLAKARRKETLGNLMGRTFGFAIGCIAAGFMLVQFIRAIIRREVNWRVALIAGVAMGALQFVVVLNAGLFWAGYDPANKVWHYVAEKTFYMAVAPIGAFLAGVIWLATFEAFFRRGFPSVLPVQHWFGRPRVHQPVACVPPTTRRLPLRRAWGEALVVGFLIGMVAVAGEVLCERLDRQDLSPQTDTIAQGRDKPAAQMPVDEEAPELKVLGGYNAAVPGLACVLDNAEMTLVVLVGVAGAIGLCWRFCKKRWVYGLVLAAAVFIAAVSEPDVRQTLPIRLALCLLGSAIVTGGVYLIVLLVRWFLRANLPAYFVAGFVWQSLGDALEMVAAPNTFEQLNGAGVLGSLALIPGIGAALLVGAGRREEVTSRPRAPD